MQLPNKLTKDTRDMMKMVFPEEETQSVQEYMGGKVDVDSY